MKHRGEWIEEYWDVIAIGGAVASAVALAAAISVAYNVTATWSDLRAAPAPPALESRFEPSEFEEAS